MSKVEKEAGSLVFELTLAGAIFLTFMLVLGWTEALAYVITGGDYRIIVQSITLTLAFLWWARYRN
jgi:hypothetical protein